MLGGSWKGRSIEPDYVLGQNEASVGAMRIAEADWKVFKKVRAEARDRFSRRVLAECEDISRDETKTAHERYVTLYRHVRGRDKEMARIFDDFQRSTALLQLMLMYKHDLLTQEEIEAFSEEVQRSLEDTGVV